MARSVFRTRSATVMTDSEGIPFLSDIETVPGCARHQSGRALDLVHLSIGGTRAEQLFECREGIIRATHDHLYPPVRQVAGVSREAEGSGVSGDEPAKPHALNRAADEITNSGHCPTSQPAADATGCRPRQARSPPAVCRSAACDARRSRSPPRPAARAPQ